MAFFCIQCGLRFKNKHKTYSKIRQTPLRWFYYYKCPICNKGLDYKYSANHKKLFNSALNNINNK